MEKNYDVRVFKDDGPANPRKEWENLGTMVCAHRKYALGDHEVGLGTEGLEYIADELGIEYATGEDGEFSVDGTLALIEEKAIMLPLELRDYSGLSMSIGTGSDPWDSMMVGVIFASREKLLRGTGYTVDELFSADKSRIPVVGNHIKVKDAGGEEGHLGYGKITDHRDRWRFSHD